MKVRTILYFIPIVVLVGFMVLGGPQLLMPGQPGANVKTETIFTKARDAITSGDVLPSFDTGSLSVGTKGSSKLYRWQDESGQWHFSNVPPEEGGPDATDASAQVSDLPEVVNTIQPPPVMPKSEPANTAPKPRFPSPTTVNPMDIPKLIEQAKGVQGLMDQRSQQIDKAIER